MTKSKTIAAVVASFALFYALIWQWLICRIYVPPGEMIIVTARLGQPNMDPENRRVVDTGYQGVRKVVLGEGRHFLNPFAYERDTARTVNVGADEIGVVKSKTGKPLPAAEFLADPPGDDKYAWKGTWRQALTPGAWRLNPVAFDVEIHKAARIYPGFVGCVTALSGRVPADGKLAEPGERGIQSRVLQPGIYYLNPAEFKVDSVEVGYRELSLSDVSFPSSDGFPIKLDITVVWGLAPSSVPDVMMHFGNIEQVVEKVIQPQIESICRIEGSKYGAKELIEGNSREKFQNGFTQTLTNVCAKRKIHVRLGLVRSIEVPMEIRQPIQQARVAMEERLSKIEQQITQGKVNQLAELQSDVEKGVREVGADTERLVAQVRAEGEKKIAQIQAELMVQVAEVEKQIAELTALRNRELGSADAKVIQLTSEAEADRIKQAVDAIGGAAAYADYQLATNLSPDFKVYVRYSGAGTLWTDLPPGASRTQSAVNLKILENPKVLGTTP